MIQMCLMMVDRRRSHVNVDIGVSVGPVRRRNIGDGRKIIAGSRKLVAREQLWKQIYTLAQNL